MGVYFCPSLRQMSYCGTSQKRERKESESVGCCTIMWLILTSLFPVCTAKVAFPHDSALGSDRCESSCTEGSLGSLRLNNLCEPKEGVCQTMVDINQVASKRCEAYAKLLPFLHPDGKGKQVHHQPSKGSWLPCAVFCQTRKGAWYSPRQELAQYFLASSLPDGTLCYSESEIQHFCQDSLCLPRDRSLTTRSLLEEGEYSPRDLLILDNQGHVLSKADATLEEEEGGKEEVLIET